MALAAGVLLVGALIIAVSALGSQAATAAATASSSTTGTSSSVTGPASAVAMLTAAKAAVGAPYSTAGHATAFSETVSALLQGGTDCSGFVSYVLKAGGVPIGGAQTTVTLPGANGIQSGPGQSVTLWNRPLAGQSGHVIIDILGTWFECGGQVGAGVVQMTSAEVASELGVSSINDLGTSTTPNGFSPLHPKGL